MPVPTLLELDRVSKRFGQVVIADDLSLTLEAGSTLGVVGPNGAGKSTLFGMVSGDVAPGSGEVRFAGRSLHRVDAAARCRLGIGRTYQVPRPFVGMTVFENTLVAAQQGGRLHRQAATDRVLDVLSETGLLASANTPAGRLGLLARKRLEVARALATGPKLLLLDEVAGGLTEPEVVELVGIIRAVNARGVAVVWIEHVVRALLSTVDRLICLAGGAVIGDGRPEDVLALPQVRQIYLGSAGSGPGGPEL
jgi:branched-chain amino acid transport system ATP-binding protein